jgi:cytochrome c oxidase cbb3-type subunit I/II
MDRPKEISKGSIMPAYTWLRTDDLDIALTAKKIAAMRKMGVPYAAGYENKAIGDLKKQAHIIAVDIVNSMLPIALKGTTKEAKVKEIESKEIIAMIAYLQRLGMDVKVKPSTK